MYVGFGHAGLCGSLLEISSAQLAFSTLEVLVPRYEVCTSSHIWLAFLVQKLCRYSVCGYFRGFGYRVDSRVGRLLRWEPEGSL